MPRFAWRVKEIITASLPNALPIGCEPAAELVPRCYTNVPAAGSSVIGLLGGRPPGPLDLALPIWANQVADRCSRPASPFSPRHRYGRPSK